MIINLFYDLSENSSIILRKYFFLFVFFWHRIELRTDLRTQVLIPHTSNTYSIPKQNSFTCTTIYNQANVKPIRSLAHQTNDDGDYDYDNSDVSSRVCTEMYRTAVVAAVSSYFVVFFFFALLSFIWPKMSVMYSFSI